MDDESRVISLLSMLCYGSLGLSGPIMVSPILARRRRSVEPAWCADPDPALNRRVTSLLDLDDIPAVNVGWRLVFGRREAYPSEAGSIGVIPAE